MHLQSGVKTRKREGKKEKGKRASEWCKKKERARAK